MPATSRILPFLTAVLLLTLSLSVPVHAGTAEVLNGHLLLLGGRAHRLADIEAPLPGRKCALRGRIIDCGRIAASQLKDLTAGADVRCRRRSDGVSVCTSNGYDLSEGMVYTGWARALNDTLAATEAAAKAARRGMWRTVPVIQKTSE